MKQKILSLLVLLMTAASGAWATSDISRALLSVPNSWGKDQAVYLTAEELPGFKAVTEEEAAKWVPTDEDLENGAFLIYGFDAEGNMLSYATLLGAPAIKAEPGKMPHNNMYALSHGSMLQLRFYYTSDVTLVGDKTEATFTMPAADATVEYELVRDMSVQMPVTVGDGQDGYRIRLKMEDEAYVLAEMQPEEARALINVHDAIENKNLAFAGDGAVCTVDIYAVDDDDKATGNAIAFADLTPGRYVAIATAADGTAYDGQTAQSNVFELYEGYKLEIGAGEFAAYYQDKNLYVEDENAQIYTITSVGEETALATPLSVAPAETPILVKNNSDELRQILLLPTENEADEVEVAPEFKGTLIAQQMPGSDEWTNYYKLSGGKIFAWVKDAGKIAANNCWLEIPTGEPLARTITIVFDDATGIDAMTVEAITTGDWFDLNGCKLGSVPTKKGVYIFNGRKVVVK